MPSIMPNAKVEPSMLGPTLRVTQSGLRVAVAWGYFTIEQVAPTLAALDAIAKRLYGLARR